MADNRCVCCGEIIPEGMIACPNCSLFGYPVTVTDYMRESVQVRKHKKKRINKKWLKRYGMRSVPSKNIVFCAGRIYVHPKTFSKIKEALRRAEDGK